MSQDVEYIAFILYLKIKKLEGEAKGDSWTEAVGQRQLETVGERR